MAGSDIPAVLNFTKVELPSIIPFNQLDQLPKRNDFIPLEARQAMQKALKSQAEDRQILFMPTDVREMHFQDEKYAKSKYKIVCFGILRTGQKAAMVIHGIEPYFEIHLKQLDKPFDKWPVDMGDIQKVKNAPLAKQEKLIEKLRIAAREVIVNDILINLQADQEPIRHEIIKGKPFKYFQEQQSEFLRLYYYKTKNRANAIKTVRTLGYETSTDDRSAYHHVEMRNRELSLSAWCVLKNYQLRPVEQIRDTIHVLHVNVADLTNFTGNLSAEENKDLLRDNTITCMWDIETHDVSGDLPLPTSATAVMFCLSATYQRINDLDPFYRISFCNLPAAPKPGHVTVICGNEKNVIKAHAKVFAMMQPEFIAGFNDSDYDWNWYITRASQYNGLLTQIAPYFDLTVPFQPYTDNDILRWHFRTEKIKVEADTYVEGKSLMLAGYIPIDVRTVFRRLYPTAEFSSLSYFLKENKLGSKEDMPYQTMFQIYTDMKQMLLDIKAKEIMPEFYSGKTIDYEPFRRVMTEEQKERFDSLLNRMGDVLWYCSVDARKCHDLLKARSVIMDSREVATLSYTTVYDAFYRANGMKVRNLAIAIGQRPYFNYRFTNISQAALEDGKYPGAWVFPPDKGVKASKLSIRERVKKAENKQPILAELPSNIDDWQNVSEEEIQEFERIIQKYGPVCDQKQIEQIELDEGPQPLHFKEFLKEPIGRPITGLDFSSLYPSLIRAYNFSPEYCILEPARAKKYQQDMERKYPGEKKFLIQVKFDFNGIPRNAYFVWHRNKMDIKDPEFQFGVYPYVLDDLFNKRKQLKKIMQKYKHRKEQIEAMTSEEQKTLADEYNEVKFQLAYINSKQSALKVFMNTFYGEAGSKISPFFVLELAGGITSYGKRAIQLAYTYVKEQKCKVYYGDSVEESTPVLIKKGNQISFTRIDQLVDEASFQEFKTSDSVSREGSSVAQTEVKQSDPEPKLIAMPTDLSVWSDQGWTPVKKVIKHRTNKQMYLVNTMQGSIAVTQDHSLLDDQKRTLQPLDALNKQLLVNPTSIPETKITVSDDAAHCIGHALWCCIYSNLRFAQRVNREALIEVRKQFNTDAVECKNCPNLLSWKIAIGVYGIGIVDYIKAFVTTARHIIDSIPFLVIGNAKEWLRGFIGNDFDSQDMKRRVAVPVQQANIAAQIMAVFRGVEHASREAQHGEHASREAQHGEHASREAQHGAIQNAYPRLKIMDGCYEIKFIQGQCNGNQVCSVEPLPQAVRTVYDLETESHHFAAGVGDIIVHNTDSLYLSVPEVTFDEVDRLFYSNQISKLEYWTKLVELTFQAIDVVREGVNKEFIRDNNTEFLTMAYEEVLYPMVPVAKKKYWGIAHESIANFKPKELFIRGLEVKKRGVSQLLRDSCMEIMWKCCDPDNVYNLLELVVLKIDQIYHQTWKPDDFIQKGVYKPTKKNVRMHTFFERMKSLGIEIKPNERFDYVMVEKYPYKYDYRGRKVELQAGDKMELHSVAVAQGLKIDLDYYMKGSINGQLARFAAYHPMFHVDAGDNTPDELKVAEQKIYENACKFVESIASRYYSKYNTYGKACQTIFRTVNKVVGGALKKYDSFASQILTTNIKTDEFDNWLIESASKKAVAEVKGYGQEFITKQLDEVTNKFLAKYAEEHELVKIPRINQLDKDAVLGLKQLKEKTLIELQKTYFASGKKSILAIREANFTEQLNVLRSRIQSNLTAIMAMMNKFSMTIEDLSNVLKQQINISELEKPTNEVRDINLDDAGIDLDEYQTELRERTDLAIEKLFDDEKFVKQFNEFKQLYTSVQSAFVFIEKTRSVVDDLKMRKIKATGQVLRPSEETIKAAITSAIEEDAEELKQLDI